MCVHEFQTQGTYEHKTWPKPHDVTQPQPVTVSQEPRGELTFWAFITNGIEIWI
jgi:hypothetical protein